MSVLVIGAWRLQFKYVRVNICLSWGRFELFLLSEFSCRGRWRLLELEEMEKAHGPGLQLGAELLPTGWVAGSW